MDSWGRGKEHPTNIFWALRSRGWSKITDFFADGVTGSVYIMEQCCSIFSELALVTDDTCIRILLALVTDDTCIRILRSRSCSNFCIFFADGVTGSLYIREHCCKVSAKNNDRYPPANAISCLHLNNSTSKLRSNTWRSPTRFLKVNDFFQLFYDKPNKLLRCSEFSILL